LGLSEDEKYRVRIRLNEVAPEMVRAVLLYEDRHFYRHPGVNPLSLLRASAGMLGGARRMGGSTITMQVARLRLGLSTTTLSGKFAQMARALQYEYHYGKGEILEAYFNLAPYGGNIEGVGAAARIYFRTTSGRLTRTESLALAVVPQNPVRRSPLNGPDFEAARARMQMLADAEDAPGGGQGATASFGASGFALGRALPPLRVYGPARLPFGLRTFRAGCFRCRGVGACAHLYRQRVAAAYGEGRCRIRGTGKALWPE
ncbi:MAG: transglycosylase domain-containing protein, partial [Bilophila wadsworthia]